MRLRSLFLWVSVVVALSTGHDDPKPVATIYRDVAILGGGSSGTYSAITLHDKGKSVVVVERKNRMGGHTETYTDPGTGRHDNYGVVVWHNVDLVRNYFARFNVPLVKASFSSSAQNLNVDLRTGNIIQNYTEPDPSAGLQAYNELLKQYPYVETGFNLTYPVPRELLLPFGEFVKEHHLEDFLPFIFGFAQGLGDLLAQPTLYVMKNFGSDLIHNLNIGFLTTERGDNSELYEKATAELGKDVLLNSTILKVDRSHSQYVQIWVKTPEGVKLIKAKRLIVTIPPKLNNLAPFDLDHTERALFSRFRNSYYYTGLLRNSGIPDNVSISNVGVDTPYHIAPLPGPYGISPSGIPGIHDVKFGSAVPLSDEQVQEDIKRSVLRLKNAGLNTTTPEFVVFSSHVPFELTVSASDIKGGFYKRLEGLQGYRGTFYTGAAFHTHDSSLIWQFTEALLPKVLSSLH